MSQVEYNTKGSKYYHIQESERKHIERMKKAGASNSEIARTLNRHRSSIGRELKRNMVSQRETIQTNSKSVEIPLYREVKHYFWDSAQRQYKIKRIGTGAKCMLSSCIEFVRYAEQKIMGPEKWSVDAAVGYAKRHQMFAVIPSTKTFYNWIDAGLCKVKNIDLLLKVKRKPKKKARERKRILGRSIDERPDVVNERKEFAHWEADGIIGKGRQGHLLTLVERVLGYGILWDAKDRCADKIGLFLDTLQAKYGEHFNSIFKSITFDNGLEFSDVDGIESKGGLTAYYAHSYSSYERGTNENWNAIVRRFLPKGSSLESAE